MVKYYNIIFIVVLVYTLAALSFWYNSLCNQNALMQRNSLDFTEIIYNNPKEKQKAIDTIHASYKRKQAQYLGEGITFLVVILIGASIVLFTFRKKLELSSQQNNFMLSVTHELKSPIAGIKLSLETLRKHKLSKEQEDNLIDNSITETNRLNDLCNNILISTQLNGKQYLNHKSEFDLKLLIENCVEAFAKRYPQRQWLFSSNIKEAIYVGDHFLWTMIINNLLENEQKYSELSPEIKIAFNDAGKEYTLEIKDQGPGISEADKKKIFEKFYRTGNENIRKSKGTGLGLYIVQQALSLHQCSIKMEDNTPTGNIAIIQIPKINE